MINYIIDLIPTRRLITFCVLLSMVLAGWMQYIQHGWINPDSILYFEQAKRFVAGDWAGMLALFKWPLYPICIGIVHQLTSLSIQASAQCLNIVFFGIATLSFLNIVRLISGNNRAIFYAAALLFSAQYIVGDVLEMLMRDEGFWAFYLSGLYFFIRFILRNQTLDAILWQVCIIIATLFRLEAILYLLLLPILFLLIHPTPATKRLMLWLKSNCIVVFIGLALAAFFILNPNTSMSHFGRLEEVFSADLYSKLTQKLYLHAENMGQDVLGSFLDEFAMAGLLISFTMIILVKTVSATGLLTTALAIWGIKKPNAMHPLAKRILLTVLFIGLFAAAMIIIERFVLSKRYLVAIIWVLILFASFQMAKLSTMKETKFRLFIFFMMLVIAIGMIKNTLPKQAAYNYRQHAVRWLNANNTQQQTVFYNDNRLIYFADAPFIGRWTDNWGFMQNAYQAGTLQKNQWLAITHSIKHPNHLSFIAEKLPEYKEVKRFANRKQRKFVIIYQRKSQ